MIRRLRSALTMACLASAAAHADYLVFKLGYDLVDLRAPTHFFLSGFQIKPDGKDSVGNLFFESGYSSAILARETLGAQVIFLAPVDKLHGKDAPFPLKRLMEMGNLGTRKLQLLARRSGDLNTGTAFGEMLNYQRIAGIHMYGHSSLFGGATLTYGHRINAFDASAQPLFRKIAERLAPDAFVTLNGCNTGYKQAPQWSALLKVPVRGTLTGTDFQELHANGQWYFHNPGQFPVGEWLTENAETYTPAIKRWEGGQVRMMPTNSLYNGSWGDFEGGLGFPKFFCNYDRGARRARNCEAAMARAAAIFPGRGASAVVLREPQVYRERVLDIMCPADSKDLRRPGCKEALRAAEKTGNRVFSSFAGWPKWGHPLECSFEGCRVYAECNDSKCVVKATQNKAPTTQVEEYLAYLRGFPQR